MPLLYSVAMLQKSEHTERFLRDLPFFKGLENADIEAFLSAGKVRDYTKNQNLFLQGDKADRFFVILNGWIKLYRNTAEGEESIVALFTRGDVFGEAAIFGGADYPFSAEAVEEARLIELPAALLKERAKAAPALMERLMRSMSREMHKLELENEHMILMSAPQRVGCLLLQLSSGMIGKGGTFTFPYDKALAAQRLGMKAETFSRALSQLKPMGVTVKGPEIKIENFQCLAEYVCGHCSAGLEDCKGAERKLCGKEGCNGRNAGGCC